MCLKISKFEKFKPVLKKSNQKNLNYSTAKGIISGVVFLDLKKAFDTVGSSEYIRVRSRQLEWFKSYLFNRFQVVYINGILSGKSVLKCGVPRDSILGPLLFLIHINDLCNMIDYATTRIYADDTNLTFTACNIPELRNDMNVDLRYLKIWPISYRINTRTCLIYSRQKFLLKSVY